MALPSLQLLLGNLPAQTEGREASQHLRWGTPLWLFHCQEFRRPRWPEVFPDRFLIAGTFRSTAFTLLIQLSVGVSFSLNFQIYTSPVSLASYLEVLMGA